MLNPLILLLHCFHFITVHPFVEKVLKTTTTTETLPLQHHNSTTTKPPRHHNTTTTTAAPSVSRPHAPAHVTKRFSPSLHHDTTPKYQPPLPTTRPAAATDSYNHSLKHPQVYQQRSSYNPLDFKGVNNLIKPPSREPNRPPGLVQRGADVHHSYQPPPLSKQQQEQRYHNTAHQPLPNVVGCCLVLFGV